MRGILVFFLVSVLIAGGCKTSGRKENSTQRNDSLATQQEKKFQTVYYRFPTPNEVFTFIKSENLAFNPALINPVSNVQKYIDSKSQTIALGVYIADLAYITIFESYNNSLAYYKAIHNLSEKVRITSAYDLEVAKRIEKNLLNLDSLKNISVESYSSMVEFLIMNNRETTLALIAAGAYAECFYIAFNLSGNYSSSNPLVAKIIDLKYAFDNLYSYLEIYSDNQQVKEVAMDMKKLKSLFDKIKEDKTNKTIVRQDKNGNLIFEGGTKLILDEKIYNQIRDEVFVLRQKFI
ncbi:MAG: hypothetical protein N2662_03880 [Bacteroidales bacterium]|nr:hypothetical protein [Bacteroidales bacterium]